MPRCYSSHTMLFRSHRMLVKRSDSFFILGMVVNHRYFTQVCLSVYHFRSVGMVGRGLLRTELEVCE